MSGAVTIDIEYHNSNAFHTSYNCAQYLEVAHRLSFNLQSCLATEGIPHLVRLNPGPGKGFVRAGGARNNWFKSTRDGKWKQYPRLGCFEVVLSDPSNLVPKSAGLPPRLEVWSKLASRRWPDPEELGKSVMELLTAALNNETVSDMVKEFKNLCTAIKGQNTSSRPKAPPNPKMFFGLQGRFNFPGVVEIRKTAIEQFAAKEREKANESVSQSFSIPRRPASAGAVRGATAALTPGRIRPTSAGAFRSLHASHSGREIARHDAYALQQLVGIASPAESPLSINVGLSTLFKNIDVNGDGKISRSELKRKLASDDEVEELLGMKGANNGDGELMFRLHEIRKLLDGGSDGMIDEKEFLAAIGTRSNLRVLKKDELPSRDSLDDHGFEGSSPSAGFKSLQLQQLESSAEATDIMISRPELEQLTGMLLTEHGSNVDLDKLIDGDVTAMLDADEFKETLYAHRIVNSPFNYIGLFKEIATNSNEGGPRASISNLLDSISDCMPTPAVRSSLKKEAAPAVKVIPPPPPPKPGSAPPPAMNAHTLRPGSAKIPLSAPPPPPLAAKVTAAAFPSPKLPAAVSERKQDARRDRPTGYDSDYGDGAFEDDPNRPESPFAGYRPQVSSPKRPTPPDPTFASNGSMQQASELAGYTYPAQVAPPKPPASPGPTLASDGSVNGNVVQQPARQFAASAAEHDPYGEGFESDDNEALPVQNEPVHHRQHSFDYEEDVYADIVPDRISEGGEEFDYGEDVEIGSEAEY